MQPSIVIAGLVGLSIILSVSIYVVARLRMEQERTLQKLIDRGAGGDELARAVGLTARPGRDLRRGVLLIAVGASWSIVTFFLGGKAWMLGVVPVTIGAAFLLLRILDGRAR